MEGTPKFMGLKRAHVSSVGGGGGLFGELPILEASVQCPVLAPQADYTSAFPLCLFSVFTLI